MPYEVSLLLAGAAGSLVHEVVVDGSVRLPYLDGGRFYLGFFGGMIIGAFVGLLVDNNLLTALFAGYTGVSTIKHLLPEVPKT